MYKVSKNSVFIAFSEVFIAGITSEEVIEPPKKEFFSIRSTLSPYFAAVYAHAHPAVPPPAITTSYLFIFKAPYFHIF